MKESTGWSNLCNYSKMQHDFEKKVDAKQRILEMLGDYIISPQFKQYIHMARENCLELRPFNFVENMTWKQGSAIVMLVSNNCNYIWQWKLSFTNYYNQNNYNYFN